MILLVLSSDSEISNDGNENMTMQSTSISQLFFLNIRNYFLSHNKIRMNSFNQNRWIDMIVLLINIK